MIQDRGATTFIYSALLSLALFIGHGVYQAKKNEIEQVQLGSATAVRYRNVIKAYPTKGCDMAADNDMDGQLDHGVKIISGLQEGPLRECTAQEMEDAQTEYAVMYQLFRR